MKGRFWRKALAAALALLIVSGSVPIQPFSRVFDDVAISASAVDITVDSTTTTWTDGTYKVTSDVNISERIKVNGTVTLNLGAGATLTASQGIEVSSGNTLIIEGSGTLTATGAEISHSNWTKKYRSGIGADAVGTIIINSGTVNATGASWAAGIGGDSYNSSGGSITINGGIVNATGNGGGAGIGGGMNGAAAGTIVINGGQVTATAAAGGAGIGSGEHGATGGSLTLGWTDYSNDFIEAKRWSDSDYPFGGFSSISFADNKLFVLDGTATQATLEKINQVGTDTKIVPTHEIVDLSNVAISGVSSHYAYTGSPISITPTVTLLNKTLNSENDYTISYKRNGTAVDAVTETGTYTLTITGNGFYTGSISCTFYVNAPVSYQAYENGVLTDRSLAYDDFVRIISSTTTMSSGWYVLTDSVTFSDRINVSGDVNLVLCDGATLTAQKGIGVTEGNSLTIYSQSGNTGKLVATVPTPEYNNCAAIGGNNYVSENPVNAGNIIIHGGIINAIGYDGACIGSAYGCEAGNITIYGGKITAGAENITNDGIGGNGANIQLGYARNDDFVKAKQYTGTVTVADNRKFVTDDVTPVDVSGSISSNETINGKKLTPKICTVMFNLNGGNGTAPAAQDSLLYGIDTVTVPAAPTRTGYDFGGWKNGSAVFDFTSAVTDNMTLTAAWTAHTYSVKFDGNGSTSGNMNDQSFTYDEDARALTANAFTRTGYTFKGWNTQANGSGTPYADKAEVQNLTTVNNDTVTLYAQWEINKYTVIWNNEDGTELEKDENVPYGTTPSYDGETPTKAATAQFSYTFSGWSDGTNTYGVNDALPNVSGNVTYTAQFDSTVNKYTVTWLDGDGNTLKTEQVAYGETPAYTGDTPTKTATAQYSYTFNNTWDKEITSVTGNETYIAQFDSTVNKYTVTWKNGDTAIETDENVEYGTTPEYNGETPTKADDTMYSYSFAGWSPEVTAITGDVTYTATFTSTPKTYNVTYKVDGVVYGEVETVAYGTTLTAREAPEAREGYTFSGWSGVPATMPDHDIEIVGTFNVDETYGKYDVTDYKANGTYPTQDGKIFAGWYSDNAYTTPYMETTGYAYAKFIDARCLTVKWQMPEGFTTEDSSTSIRLISSLDCGNYQSMHIVLEFADYDKIIKDGEITRLLDTLNGYVGENQIAFTPQEVFCDDSKYFAAYTINGMPKALYNYNLKAYVYIVTQDGTTVVGEATTFKVAE